MANNPLTWRTIVGPSIADAAAPLREAARSINMGFDQFGNLAQKSQDVQNANVLAIDEAAKQGYLDQLQQAATPEALAANAAALEAQRAGLSVTNRAATRGAVDARTTALRQQFTAANAYNDEKQALAERPIKEQISALAASAANAKDPAEAAALYQQARQLANDSPLRNKGAVFDEITKHQREGTKFSWEVDAQRRAGERHTADLEHLKNTDRIAEGQLTVSQGQLGVQQGQLAVSQENARLERLSKLEKIQSDVVERLGKVSAEDPNSTAGSAAIGTQLSHVIKDPDELTKVLSFVSKARTNQKYSHLSVGDFVTAATSVRNVSSWWRGDNENDFLQNLDTLAGKKSAKEASDLRASTKGAASLQLKDVKTATDQALYEYLGGKGPVPTAPALATASTTTPAATTPATAANEPPRKNLIADLAGVEQQLLAAGEIKDLSPAVKKHLEKSGAGKGDDQAAQDRAALVEAGRSIGGGLVSGTKQLGVAAADIFTLPVRGAMGAANTVLRLPNAMGADIPYLPTDALGLNSITPYSDSLARSQMKEVPRTTEELKAVRAALQKELADATKKAK